MRDISEYNKETLSTFEYDHLSVNVQPIMKSFWHLAHLIFVQISDREEKYQALRKLLDARNSTLKAAAE